MVLNNCPYHSFLGKRHVSPDLNLLAMASLRSRSLSKWNTFSMGFKSGLLGGYLIVVLIHVAWHPSLHDCFEMGRRLDKHIAIFVRLQ